VLFIATTTVFGAVSYTSNPESASNNNVDMLSNTPPAPVIPIRIDDKPAGPVAPVFDAVPGAP